MLVVMLQMIVDDIWEEFCFVYYVQLSFEFEICRVFEEVQRVIVEYWLELLNIGFWYGFYVIIYLLVLVKGVFDKDVYWQGIVC